MKVTVNKYGDDIIEIIRSTKLNLRSDALKQVLIDYEDKNVTITSHITTLILIISTLTHRLDIAILKKAELCALVVKFILKVLI